MTRFVLDNSVAMRWLLSSNQKQDQSYAEAVLNSLCDASAVVPALWHLEASNVLINAERRGELEIYEIERFISQLDRLPISTDALTAQQAFGHTLSIARIYNLSSYDAAYLELCLRGDLPMATLDRDLRHACRKTDVPLYLV